jgi:hypothetical protein
MEWPLKLLKDARDGTRNISGTTVVLLRNLKKHGTKRNARNDADTHTTAMTRYMTAALRQTMHPLDTADRRAAVTYLIACLTPLH